RDDLLPDRPGRGGQLGGRPRTGRRPVRRGRGAPDEDRRLALPGRGGAVGPAARQGQGGPWRGGLRGGVERRAVVEPRRGRGPGVRRAPSHVEPRRQVRKGSPPANRTLTPAPFSTPVPPGLMVP